MPSDNLRRQHAPSALYETFLEKLLPYCHSHALNSSVRKVNDCESSHLNFPYSIALSSKYNLLAAVGSGNVYGLGQVSLCVGADDLFGGLIANRIRFGRVSGWGLAFEDSSLLNLVSCMLVSFAVASAHLLNGLGRSPIQRKDCIFKWHMNPCVLKLFFNY